MLVKYDRIRLDGDDTCNKHAKYPSDDIKFLMILNTQANMSGFFLVNDMQTPLPPSETWKSRFYFFVPRVTQKNSIIKMQNVLKRIFEFMSFCIAIFSLWIMVDFVFYLRSTFKTYTNSDFILF